VHIKESRTDPLKTFALAIFISQLQSLILHVRMYVGSAVSPSASWRRQVEKKHVGLHTDARRVNLSIHIIATLLLSATHLKENINSSIVLNFHLARAAAPLFSDQASLSMTSNND